MSKFLKRYIDTIFVMLGTGCNLHCRYCLQQCQELPQLPTEVSPDIIEFIKETSEENLDGYGPLSVHFYGGEPMLYFDKIKEIVEKTEGMNVQYSVITNGVAITKERAEFMNEHNFAVMISWDGPNVKKTRLYDVLEKNFDNIMSLDNLGLSAVISAESYPRDILEGFNEMDKRYGELHGGRHLAINTDYIFDTGIADKALINEIDYGRVRQECYDLTKEYIEARKRGEEDLPQYRWQAMFYNDISWFYSNGGLEGADIMQARCGNGYNVLNMDLGGNLYACHNIFEPIGDIYSSYFSYLSEVIKGDNVIGTHKDCNNCPAVAMCYGGCKLLKRDSKEKKSYCAIRKAVFGGVLDAYIEYGQQLHDEGKKESEEV